MSWNCRGIINLGIQSILIDYVCKNRLHVVALQETHLNGQSLYIPNYKIYRRDRNNNGGGVALLIRKDISSRQISIGNTHKFETIAVELLSTVGNLVVASVYSPTYTPNFPNVLNTIFNVPNIIAMGDFNAKSPAWNGCAFNQAGHALLDFQEDSLVRILHPDRHTRISARGDASSTLDFFITNTHCIISQPSLIDQLLSDHYAIEAVVTASATVPPQIRPNYKKANWVLYKQLLSQEARVLSQLPLTLPDELDTAVDAIVNSILHARDTSIPSHPISWDRRNTPADTLAWIRELRRVNRRLRTCLPSEEDHYRSLKRNAKKALDHLSIRDRNDRWSEFTNSLNENSKNFWRVAKRLRTGPNKFPPLRRPDQSMAIDPKEKVELIADAFLRLHEPGREHIDDLDTPIINRVERWLLQTQHVVRRPFPPFTSAEVNEVWQRWRPFKCPGQDGVQNILLKHLPPPFVDALTQLYNASLRINF